MVHYMEMLNLEVSLYFKKYFNMKCLSVLDRMLYRVTSACLNPFSSNTCKPWLVYVSCFIFKLWFGSLNIFQLIGSQISWMLIGSLISLSWLVLWYLGSWWLSDVTNIDCICDISRLIGSFMSWIDYLISQTLISSWIS